MSLFTLLLNYHILILSLYYNAILANVTLRSLRHDNTSPVL